MKSGRQSPIPVKPLRRPGASLQKKIIDSYIGPVYFLGILPVLAVGVLIGSWHPMTHWQEVVLFIITVLLYEVLVYFLYARKAGKNIACLKLGYEGEVYVGQQLDEMRENGWLVLHDFDTGKGNIDHIIIAPQGVFTLETKTVSQLGGEETTIYYDCEKVWTNKRNIDSPLKQAKGEAGYLANRLREKLTMNVFVQPIVNYPGWRYGYKGRKSLNECEVWICQTTSLATVIGKKGIALSPEEMRRIYNFLASENRM